MTMGKSWDTHCPFGPYIVTSDEIDDPHNLALKTFVNDEERQNTNTNLMIYDCYTLIEYLTTAFTLEPGDLIPTGTPEGSALTTQNWLKPGDKVKVEIEGLGYIENNIIQEPNNTQKKLNKYDVAICGYGPVGSLCSLLMADYGYKVLLIDKNIGTSPTARAINTDGEQLRIFDKFGLAEKIVENSNQIEKNSFFKKNLEPIQSITQTLGDSSMGWPNQVLFYQPELEGFVREVVGFQRKHRCNGIVRVN